MEDFSLEIDEDLTVEEVELIANRVQADPKHELHKPYWTGNDPSHKIAVGYMQKCYERINELRNPIETPPSVETPITADLDFEEAEAKLEAMKANSEVRAIFARGKKHPLYAKTLEEWTALHQLAYDSDGELEKSVKSWDLEEGMLESSTPPPDVGDQYMEQVDHIDSLIDRGVHIEDVEKAFWGLYDEFGDQDRRDEAEEKVSFYVRNHANLADRLNREILKNALTAAFKA